MIWTIVKKEIQGNIHSYKFIIIFILLGVLISASLFTMYRDYQLRQENYEILRPTSKEPVAIIPPTPLSIFVKGLDESMGRSFRIIFGGQIQSGGNQQSANDLFRLFTTPDLLYIVKVILALCAMLFSFDMISGEKELRTLSLSLSYNVRRSSLIIGKWIGGFISLIVPFFAVLLTGIIILSFSPHVYFSPDDWIKLSMFLISSVIYVAIFFSLGLFISCITYSSASSLVISLFMWALVVFVIPNLGNTLARQFVDIPSIYQLEMKREHIWIKEVFGFIRNMKQGNTSQSQNDMVANINSENDKIMADYRTRFNELATLSKNITRFSPTSSFTYLAADITGTGINEENRLKQAVLMYKDMVWDKPTDSGGNILGDFPVFSYNRKTVRQVVSDEGILNLAVLFLFNVLAFSAAYVAFLRYDIR